MSYIKKYLFILFILSCTAIMCSCHIEEISSSYNPLSSPSNSSKENVDDTSFEEVLSAVSEEENSKAIHSAESLETSENYSEQPSENESKTENSVEDGSSNVSQDDLNGMGVNSIYDNEYGGYYRRCLLSLNEIGEIIGNDLLDPYCKKTFYENGIYNEEYDQLPTLIYFIREFGIEKEDFIRVNNIHKDHLISVGREYEEYVFSDREIDVIFSGDEELIKKELKLDTAFLYDGKLYDIYQIYYLAEKDVGKIKEFAANSDLITYLEHMSQYEGVINNILGYSEDPMFYNKPIDFIISKFKS
ncbi:MAG: hypothetical protein E7614_03855 [Ruminococcaceae bacterium]|nr:hypothetical protein [Oscillospiraceae bacterium]